jgi:hypothetical protein
VQKFLKCVLGSLSRYLEKRLDHEIVPGTTLENHRRILQMLIPVNNNVELIRIGSLTDGGYLIPNDLSGIQSCISPGVADNWEFELELLSIHQIKSLMIDASIESPKLKQGLEFRKYWIGPANDETTLSMNSVIRDQLAKGNHELLLQMDIEGAEYATLLATDLELLSKFRIVVIEFHDLEMWKINSYFTKVVYPLFARLTELFDVVHLHPNNGGLNFNWHGVQHPSGIEVTFHRKDRANGYSGSRVLPNKLDSLSNADSPEVKFPRNV